MVLNRPGTRYAAKAQAEADQSWRLLTTRSECKHIRGNVPIILIQGLVINWQVLPKKALLEDSPWQLRGLRPPNPPAALGGFAPRPSPLQRGYISPVGHDMCTMIIVHACAIIIVHACTMIIVHACTSIIVHTCIWSYYMHVLSS